MTLSAPFTRTTRSPLSGLSATTVFLAEVKALRAWIVYIRVSSLFVFGSRTSTDNWCLSRSWKVQPASAAAETKADSSGLSASVNPSAVAIDGREDGVRNSENLQKFLVRFRFVAVVSGCVLQVHRSSETCFAVEGSVDRAPNGHLFQLHHVLRQCSCLVREDVRDLSQLVSKVGGS
eukprot:CAMPEP_0206510372 /NCGR_PEP_ID=MMETSP0324_2-20121206/59606_1 /ASSEMBLY_ACC=CAM_ASM_000836 /TAXON_ID=2866 /ORGANISM="Crypthecodinium cohnii, Strain Seligo" /LENGTH=176 /DNA_ID=CAMNT_0054001849 /DNA_START=49 /DNA_END=574 /DNA_ORIENTATION=-